MYAEANTMDSGNLDAGAVAAAQKFQNYIVKSEVGNPPWSATDMQVHLARCKLLMVLSDSFASRVLNILLHL